MLILSINPMVDFIYERPNWYVCEINISKYLEKYCISYFKCFRERVQIIPTENYQFTILNNENLRHSQTEAKRKKKKKTGKIIQTV